MTGLTTSQQAALAALEQPCRLEPLHPELIQQILVHHVTLLCELKRVQLRDHNEVLAHNLTNLNKDGIAMSSPGGGYVYIPFDFDCDDPRVCRLVVDELCRARKALAQRQNAHIRDGVEAILDMMVAAWCARMPLDPWGQPTTLDQKVEFIAKAGLLSAPLRIRPRQTPPPVSEQRDLGSLVQIGLCEIDRQGGWRMELIAVGSMETANNSRSFPRDSRAFCRLSHLTTGHSTGQAPLLVADGLHLGRGC